MSTMRDIIIMSTMRDIIIMSTMRDIIIMSTMRERRHHIFRSAMCFPQTDHLMIGAEKESPIATLSFACGGSSKDVAASCDMSALAACLAGNPDLIAWGAHNLAAEVVDDIARHQDHYTPQKLDGFVVARDGQYLVHLKREGAATDGRTGFIDLAASRGDLERDEKAATLAAAYRDAALESHQQQQRNACTIC